jgi:hypothetical protein
LSSSRTTSGQNLGEGRTPASLVHETQISGL